MISLISMIGLLLLVSIIWLVTFARRNQVHKQPLVLSSGLLLVLLSLVTYSFLGQPSLVMQQAQQRAELAANQTLIDQLQTRLTKQPNDIDGWLMLGHSYRALTNHIAARDAYEKAYQLDGNHAPAMLALAETLAELNGGEFSQRAQALIATAVRLAPENPEALWLGGVVANQQGDLKQAHVYWSRLNQQTLPGSAEHEMLTNLLKDIEKVLGL